MTICNRPSGSSTPRDIPEILERGARLYPRRKAVSFDGRSYSYAALDRDADRFAGRLARECGVGRGDRVAILLRNSPEYIVSFFGVLKAAAIAVPLNYFLTPHEIRYIVDDCEAKVIVTSGEFRELVSQIFEKLPALQDVIYIDNGGREEPEPLSREASPRTGGEVGDTAVIIYTSGTTGHPKGAMLTHGNIISNIIGSAAVLEISRKDRLLLVLPVFHSFTITACILMPLYEGMRIIMLRSVRPFEKVVRAMLFKRISIFVGIPAIFNILVNMKFPWWARFFLRLRICISGSAPLPRVTLEMWREKFPFPLLEGYGLTEASPVVSINPLRRERKIGSVGLSIPGVEVRILKDGGADDEAGEIIVKGPSVMKGYYNRPQDTAKAFHEGWLRTSDMGKIDDDGYLFIVGRKSEMILVRGMNVYEREIEEVLYNHPKVGEAAVVGREDEKHGEIPVAFLATVDGERVTQHEVREHCARQLARYKIPRKFIFLKSLPRTSTGKILKRELKRMAREV